MQIKNFISKKNISIIILIFVTFFIVFWFFVYLDNLSTLIDDNQTKIKELIYLEKTQKDLQTQHYMVKNKINNSLNYVRKDHHKQIIHKLDTIIEISDKEHNIDQIKKDYIVYHENIENFLKQDHLDDLKHQVEEINQSYNKLNEDIKGYINEIKQDRSNKSEINYMFNEAKKVIFLISFFTLILSLLTTNYIFAILN